MRITVDLLERLGACSDGLAEFERLYPDGVELNAENLAKCPHSLDVGFLLMSLPDERIQRWKALSKKRQAAYMIDNDGDSLNAQWEKDFLQVFAGIEEKDLEGDGFIMEEGLC